MGNKSKIDSNKIEMIESFYFEVKKVFREFFKANISIEGLQYRTNRYFDACRHCRIDLINKGDGASVKVLNDDSELTIKYPNWLDDGRGCVVESKNKILTLNIECKGSGKLNLNLKGLDFRNTPEKRIPIYINYKELIYNNELIFNNNQFAWHNKSYNYDTDCKDGEKITVQINFETIFDYFPELIEFQNKINYEFNTFEDIEKISNEIEDYVIQQKLNLKESIDAKELYEDQLKLTKDFNNLVNEFNTYKNNTEKVLNSYNLFFNSLFKFNKVEPIQLVKYSRELNNQLLDFINNICKKYDLEWWIDFGLLLGAIRHESAIPWDDDYDISMLREDYDKFFNIIHDELKENNLSRYIQVNLNKKGPNNSILLFTKFELFDKGRLFGFVDIYPYDYIEKEIEDYEHVQDIYFREHRNAMTDMRNGVDRNEMLDRYFKLFNVSKTKTDTLILGVEHFNYNQNRYDDIFPLKEIKFENRYYPSPNNGKEVLKQEYGSDFMTVPKSAYNHGFFDALMRHDDAIEVFKEHIARLKEVNEKLSNDY